MINILIVDDDDELRSILFELFKSDGYSIDVASSGEEAIEKASLNNFDIVLLDLVMPKINGMDTLSEIRKISPQTSIIIMTGFATIQSAVEAIKNGASDYIAKPVDHNALNVIIKRTYEEAKFDETPIGTGLGCTIKFLSSDLRREIVKLIYMNRGMRLMELTKTLDIEDHTKVYFHLKKLKVAGLIKQQNKVYFLTDEGNEILNCLKILESRMSGSSLG